jgi:hypothetical protein
MDHRAGAEQIFIGALAVGAGAEQRDVQTSGQKAGRDGGCVDERGGENVSCPARGDDRAGAIGRAHEDRAIGMKIPLETGGAIAQIESGWWKAIALAAENGSRIEIASSKQCGLGRIENADFGDARGKRGGYGRRRSQNIKYCNGPIVQDLMRDFAGGEQYIDTH